MKWMLKHVQVFMVVISLLTVAGCCMILLPVAPPPPVATGTAVGAARFGGVGDRGPAHRFEPVEDWTPNRDRYPNVMLTPVQGGEWTPYPIPTRTPTPIAEG